MVKLPFAVNSSNYHPRKHTT